MGNVEGRIRWLELLKAINACLPTGEDPKPARTAKKRWPTQISRRKELHVTNIDCQQVDDESGVVRRREEVGRNRAGRRRHNAGDCGARRPPAAAPADNPAGAQPTPSQPCGSSNSRGHHYHNADRNNMAPNYVRNTLIKNLREKTIELPTGDNGQMEEVSMKDLGISYPVLVESAEARTT